MASNYLDCYCAFCKNPRRVYRKKSLSFINILQSLALGLGSSYLIWGKPDPRALVIVVTSLMLIESFILLRARSDVVCPHCGFDPQLYLKDKKLAAEKVKLHIETRQGDPNVWLGRKPPIKARRPKKGKSTREIVV